MRFAPAIAIATELNCWETCETLPVNCLHMPRYDATTEIVSGATNEPVRTRFCTERLGMIPPEVMSIPPANAVRT